MSWSDGTSASPSTSFGGTAGTVLDLLLLLADLLLASSFAGVPALLPLAERLVSWCMELRPLLLLFTLGDWPRPSSFLSASAVPSSPRLSFPWVAFNIVCAIWEGE